MSPRAVYSFGRAATAAEENDVRHCPECRRPQTARRDVCPECWVALADGRPGAAGDLSLVFETSALFEADLLEGVLRDEGIPCLRVPNGVTLPPGADGLTRLRLYVRSDMAPWASDLVAEVIGRAPGL
jgi:hypothetical protein